MSQREALRTELREEGGTHGGTMWDISKYKEVPGFGDFHSLFFIPHSSLNSGFSTKCLI
jgi:hypothetical protein